jgi:hypothetical protein
LLSATAILWLRRWHPFLLLAFSGSAGAFIAPHMIILPAADYRYLYYAYFCAYVLAFFAACALLTSLGHRIARTISRTHAVN